MSKIADSTEQRIVLVLVQSMQSILLFGTSMLFDILLFVSLENLSKMCRKVANGLNENTKESAQKCLDLYKKAQIGLQSFYAFIITILQVNMIVNLYLFLTFLLGNQTSMSTGIILCLTAYLFASIATLNKIILLSLNA